MPTDGIDFLRRRPLYGKFYVALKNGASPQELASLAIQGVAKEINLDRPLIALEDVMHVVLSALEQSSFSSDAQQAEVLNMIQAIEKRHGEHATTRDLCEAARCIGLQAYADGEKLDKKTLAQKILQRFAHTWCLNTVADILPPNRELLSKALSFEAGVLADAILRSENGKVPRKWRKELNTPIQHNSDSLKSEILAPME